MGWRKMEDKLFKYILMIKSKLFWSHCAASQCKPSLQLGTVVHVHDGQLNWCTWLMMHWPILISHTGVLDTRPHVKKEWFISLRGSSGRNIQILWFSRSTDTTLWKTLQHLTYEMLKCCVVICDVFCINITAVLLWMCHFAAEVELALTSLWGSSPTEARCIHTQRSAGVF